MPRILGLGKPVDPRIPIEVGECWEVDGAFYKLIKIKGRNLTFKYYGKEIVESENSKQWGFWRKWMPRFGWLKKMIKFK